MSDESLISLKNQFPAAPEYLAQIFFIGRDKGIVSNSDLAARLRVSRPAVSQAVRRLKKLGLVIQERYGAIDLTAKGRALAEKTVRRHFLLEHLLVQALGYPWDKSDTEAVHLQASLSDELTSYLLRHFDNPSTCPHGNPLPGSSVEREYLAAPTLAEAEVGASVRIIRITEEGELIYGMLSFCQKNGLAPGRVITYNRNSSANELFEKAGIEVLEIDGSELVRGRGGPRCMSMPILRGKSP